MSVILLSVGLGGGAAVLIILAGVILGPSYYQDAKTEVQSWLPNEDPKQQQSVKAIAEWRR